MALLQFRVRQFRSIEDSGWITCDDVTTLVGVNEAGKSNLLLALWKLNPAKGGEINLLADLPRRLYSTARSEPGKITFIEADFELSEEATKAVAEKCLIATDQPLRVRLSKTFAGDVGVEFLNATPAAAIRSSNFHKVVTDNLARVRAEAATPELEEAKAAVEERLEQILEKYPTPETSFSREQLDELKKHTLMTLSLSKPSAFQAALEAVRSEIERLERYFVAPHLVPGVKEVVLKAIPKFVYYSNYGNLDSEIYLPHALENMQRTDLTGVAEAKARTLRVLFKYVGLDPKEIMEMGKEPVQVVNHYGQVVQQVSEEQIAEAARKKTERQALLHSAQSRLSREFREWWKQGEYSFDFRADGNYFRIFASEPSRPEPIELENRSAGLQWFLSFYLVFLVESEEAHAGAILLLDEAGHSLHPLAQRDLAQFFANLSKTNQVIHTTQSPFLVDTNHIDRVRVVYVDDNGFTVASENLRAAESPGSHQRSVYAVHAALGLSVSDTLLQGCLPVIVEGVSDQIYLNAIKNWLIREKQIAPPLEIVFVPSGGTKGVKPLSSLLTGREGELPPVVLDSDDAGRAMQASLAAELYKPSPERLIAVGDFAQVQDAELEDLIPFSVLEPLLNKLFREVDELFADHYDPARPLVAQVQGFAGRKGVALDPGWKVTLAKGFKNRLLARTPPPIDKPVLANWKKLFSRMLKE